MSLTSTKKMLGSSGDLRGLRGLSEEERRRLQRILLEMCGEITEFCDSRGIRCILAGGSLLGAVRHGGFIPWDDDMDLCMPRGDYDRFAELFTKEKGDRYDVYVPDSAHHALNLFMKVSKKGTVLEDIYTEGSPYPVGVTIDVFPVEHVPASRPVRYLKGIFLNVFRTAAVSAYMYRNRSGPLKEVYRGSLRLRLIYGVRIAAGAAMSFRDYEWWYRLFDRFARSPEGSGLCTVPTGTRRYFGEMREWRVLFPPKKVPFEQTEMWGAADPDAYLRSMYGDYMTLPPETQRERHFYVRAEF